MERTLLIIKPNAVIEKHIGEIIKRIENEGFEIIGIKMLKLTLDEAENFYYIHRGKPFFHPFVHFMCSERSVFMVMEGNDVIRKLRDFIGDTDPMQAPKGSIRSDFGKSVRENAVHASDSVESSKFEVNFFFPELAW